MHRGGFNLNWSYMRISVYACERVLSNYKPYLSNLDLSVLLDMIFLDKTMQFEVEMKFSALFGV